MGDPTEQVKVYVSPIKPTFYIIQPNRSQISREMPVETNIYKSHSAILLGMKFLLVQADSITLSFKQCFRIPEVSFGKIFRE